jgi:negative regulator of sigma E activity
MNEKYAEALSAFFDGERIDAELLAESLAAPGASALLSEFAAMRGQVERDVCRPSLEFLETTADQLHRLQKRRRWRGRFVTLAVAASVLLAVGVTGFKLGLSTESQRHRNAPGMTALAPPATRAEPIHAASPPATSSVDIPRQSARPPAKVVQAGAPPDASLRLRFGRWSDLSSPAAPEEPRGTK